MLSARQCDGEFEIIIRNLCLSLFIIIHSVSLLAAVQNIRTLSLFEILIFYPRHSAHVEITFYC